MTQEDDTTLVVNGSLRTIEYAVTASGAMPAKEFIKELDDGDKRKLDVLFRRMAEMGRIFNREQFKQVEGKIYEFKRFQLRIGCFQAEHRWVLTQGFFKKSDK